MKTLLREYNGMCSASESYDCLTFSEAVAEGILESRLNGLGCSCPTIATGSRRHIIDAYLTYCRSEEEQLMLKQEGQLLVSYYDNKQKIIWAKIMELSNNGDRISRGATALLKQLFNSTNISLKQARQTCSSFSDREDPSPEDDYSSSDYSYDDDSDYDWFFLFIII